MDARRPMSAKFHLPVGAGPQAGSVHPSCERVTSSSAGYDCVINATVREGQGMTAETTPPFGVAQKPWVWAPLVCAGPLTTSLRGLWVSGLLPPGNGGTNEGASL